MNLLFTFFAFFTLSQALRKRQTSQFTSTFQGCFSGTGRELRDQRVSTDNLNSRCIDYCREKVYPIATTKGNLCACSNSPLGLLPRVARPEDGNATGPDSPCNQRCPGTPGRGACNRDTCCGGDRSYSVFIVGNIDSIKAILERSQAALTRNNNARLKELWTSGYGIINPDFRTSDYTKKYGIRLWGHYTRSRERKAEDCWNRCKSQSQCTGCTWSVNPWIVQLGLHNCWLMSPGTKETKETGWTTYLKGKERIRRTSYRSNRRLRLEHLDDDYFSGMAYPLECRKKCLERRHECGRASLISFSNESHTGTYCRLYKYKVQPAWQRWLFGPAWQRWRFCWQRWRWQFISSDFEKPLVEVETTAAPLNDKGEQTGKKKMLEDQGV